MKDLKFVKDQNELINSISSRGNLILEIVKLILALLENNLKSRQKITRNYSLFTSQISKIDICLKKRILEVAQHYNLEVTSQNEVLKKLISKFLKLKNEITKKFSIFLKSITQKKKSIDVGRKEFMKIQALNDDFIFQRWLASNKDSMKEKEESFHQELISQTKEIVELDTQILEEFDKILHEIDNKKVSSISSWNPLGTFNQNAIKEYFDNLPIFKQHVTEKIAFLDAKCKHMQLYTLRGSKVYCFGVVAGTDKLKMSEKFNFRQELQPIVGLKKPKVLYFETKTPIFTTNLSDIDLFSIAMGGSIKIKVPSSKWYKKTDKITLYFRDYDEMSEFMESFKLEIPGSIIGAKKTESQSAEASNGSSNLHVAKYQESPQVHAAELEHDFLTQEAKEGRLRIDSQATLHNEA